MAVRYGDAPMTLRLTIDEPAWRRHVDSVRARVGTHLVPVVKGNGYGVGRARLVAEASAWAGTIAVGTVHEALEIPSTGSADVLCLTPALEVPDVLAPPRIAVWLYTRWTPGWCPRSAAPSTWPP